jgi:1,4-dihydroxy-2-naphthoyl-CoA hydrolase
MVGALGYRGAAMASPGLPTAEQLNEAVSGFDRLYGLRFVAFGATEVRAEVDVREEIKQPMGLVHGGLYASLAESMTSLATAFAVIEQGKIATGMSNSTSFLRPITAGRVHARATRLHRGRTTWVWDVTFSDDAGRTCAVTRMTIAVRPPPRQQAPSHRRAAPSVGPSR